MKRENALTLTLSHPMGEGTPFARLLGSLGCAANPATDFPGESKTILPLRGGEGRGEGGRYN